MYESLRDWMDVPIPFRPFVKRNGAGDKTFSDPKEIQTYPVYEIKYVRNSLGAEVITTHHLYIDGDESVSLLDEVKIDTEWLPIQAIETFFRDGKPDIKVVHI